METLEENQLCFPELNTSCRKPMHFQLQTIFISSLLTLISLLTAVLNLLVIISVSHFRQLHTTTNFLLLSLAVTDFIIGLLQMPFEIYVFQGCWLLGESMCALNGFFAYMTVSVSVGTMVLISVDRYVAICDPMLYTTKVTVKRVQLSICLCWVCSAVHSTWILRDFLKHSFMFSSCHGECVVLVSVEGRVVDLVMTFAAPILVIIGLYIRVFVVAVSQARAMRSHGTTVTQQRSEMVKPKKSELKAARTLGVVVVVFILCSSPFYCLALAAESAWISISSAAPVIWLIGINSSLNPVIYALLYPWFRKSMKQIVTLQILKPNSCQTNLS